MGAEQHTEIERKYDVPVDVPVPELHVLPDVARVTPPETIELEATYFDTPSLALARAGMTLRRRTGGADAGWHLKLPLSKDRREEMRLPLVEQQEEVPAELLDRVRAFVRDHPVAPVTLLRNRRVVHRLLGADGATLAEVCDDHVTAESRPDGATAQQWREWEVELVEGASTILDAVETLMLEAGASPAASSSKLARALGDRVPQVRPPSKKRLARGSTGELLSAYLSKHVSRLQQEDLQLRSGDTEGVHQMRIAARRLRSALTTYRPVLEPGSTDVVRAELKWLGGVLAEARDAQVMRERLSRLLDTQPVELVLGPVARRIDDEMDARFKSGRADADLALGSERYFRLLDQLDALCAAPGFADAAGRPVRRELPRLLQADLNRVRKRHRAVVAADTPEARSLALHEVRKAAKRLRYAAETAQPVFGKRAKRLAARAEAIQEVLGEHQDTVVARATLREIGIRAHLAGENGFTFGRLHALEEARAEELVRGYPPLMKQLPARKLKVWLEH